jgi:ribosomal protein L35
MPKQKTRKSAAKRIMQTGGGTFTHRHSGRTHTASIKGPRRMRHLAQETAVYSGRVKMLSRQLPYGA